MLFKNRSLSSKECFPRSSDTYHTSMLIGSNFQTLHLNLIFPPFFLVRSSLHSYKLFRPVHPFFAVLVVHSGPDPFVTVTIVRFFTAT